MSETAGHSEVPIFKRLTSAVRKPFASMKDRLATSPFPYSDSDVIHARRIAAGGFIAKEDIERHLTRLKKKLDIESAVREYHPMTQSREPLDEKTKAALYKPYDEFPSLPVEEQGERLRNEAETIVALANRRKQKPH